MSKPTPNVKQQAPTLATVWRDYRGAKNLEESTMRLYDSNLNKHLSDWLKLPISEITKANIEARHARVSETAPGIANVTMRILRALFYYAMERYDNADGQPLIKVNPVLILKRGGWNPEQPRQRYVHRDQYRSWYLALMKVRRETIRDFFMFLAFTGCRKTEACRLKWEDVNFELRQVTVRKTKNHRDHTLPVCAYVMALLARRHAARAPRSL